MLHRFDHLTWHLSLAELLDQLSTYLIVGPDDFEDLSLGFTLDLSSHVDNIVELLCPDICSALLRESRHDELDELDKILGNKEEQRFEQFQN